MTKSKEYVEQIKKQVEVSGSREQLLVHALGEALSSADRKLLDDVRSVAIEHETRRALILDELQTLAARIGTFPASSPQPDIIEYEPPDLPYEPSDEELEDVVGGARADKDMDSEPDISLADAGQSSGGDWRRALENIRSGAGLPARPLRKAG